MAHASRKSPQIQLRTAVLSIALSVTGMVLAGCTAPPDLGADGTPEIRDFGTPLPTVTPPSEPLDIVLAWIECEDECEPHLQAVVRLGPDATAILIQTVTEGPPPERLETMQRHLAQTYQELAAYGETHPEAALRIGTEEYVGFYLDNYDALYRIRSAQALVAIGDTQAFGALQEALRSAERQDVREALQEALRALGLAPPGAGSRVAAIIGGG